MTGHEEAKGLLEQSLILVRAQSSDENLIPVNVALYLLSKAILRLAQSVEDNRSPTSPSEPSTHI
jgi:hypothetical protein